MENYIETTGTRGAVPAPREPEEDLRTAEANEASAARTSLRKHEINVLGDDQ